MTSVTCDAHGISHQSGVYAIVHISTGRQYIGSAFDLAVRWQRHKTNLRGGYHVNPHLQHAWDRWGEDAFGFEVLEYVDRAKVISAEQRWLDSLRPHYNIAQVAGNTAGLRPSPAAMDALALGPKSRLGKPVSDQTRARISAALMGHPSANKGNPLTDEQKEKIRLAKRGVPWTPARRAAHLRKTVNG